MEKMANTINWMKRHPSFEVSDLEFAGKIARLSKKYSRQAVNSCNGYGVVKGKMYYNGSIDAYAKREYGYSVQSAYVKDDETVFDLELDAIRNKIKALVQAENKHPMSDHWKVEFQGDPRGQTVKLFFSTGFDKWELFNLIDFA